MTARSLSGWGSNSRIRYAAALLVILSLLISRAAYGLTFCRCIEPGLPAQELEKAAAVFTGRVDDIRWLGGNYDHVHFKVEEAWKGVTGPEMKIYTQHPSLVERVLGPVVGCGYMFEEGESYLVYTYTDKASPHKVSSCGRTKKLNEAAWERRELGPPAMRFDR